LNFNQVKNRPNSRGSTTRLDVIHTENVSRQQQNSPIFNVKNINILSQTDFDLINSDCLNSIKLAAVAEQFGINQVREERLITSQKMRLICENLINKIRIVGQC
jgi:hypothetical protein